MEVAFFSLLAVFLLREWHFQRTTKELVDRLMSRNYSDFKFAQNYGQRDMAEPKANIDEFEQPDILEGVNPLT